MQRVIGYKITPQNWWNRRFGIEFGEAIKNGFF
jgi:hypothetical protein